jgi:hypothetical protein
LAYWDDDCDWDGLYFYTIDLNNFVTHSLIKLFENPIKSASGKTSTAHNKNIFATRADEGISGHLFITQQWFRADRYLWSP